LKILTLTGTIWAQSWSPTKWTCPIEKQYQIF
jgi:hypothetical protein